MAITLTKKRHAKTARKARPAVDYPKRNEVITSPLYTLRLAVPVDGAGVEVSIDRGPWQPCRESVGYWWFDWSGYDEGEHEVVVRARTPEGEVDHSEPHGFLVRLETRP